MGYLKSLSSIWRAALLPEVRDHFLNYRCATGGSSGVSEWMRFGSPVHVAHARFSNLARVITYARLYAPGTQYVRASPPLLHHGGLDPLRQALGLAGEIHQCESSLNLNTRLTGSTHKVQHNLFS